MTFDYEAVVVGGGPAGLSAALVLGRCLRRTLLLDNGAYRNSGSQALHCFLSRDGTPPLDLLAEARQQLGRYASVALRADTVEDIRRLEGGGFEVHTRTGTFTSACVLLATGTKDKLPDITGLAACYGRSVHVCPYCDAWENRDSAVAVLGAGEKAANFAALLRHWTPDLVLCSNGPAGLGPQEEREMSDLGIRVLETPVAELEAEEGRLQAMVFADGTRLPRTSIFLSLGQRLQDELIRSLGCDVGSHGVVCDEDGHTSVPGVFVAGDVSRDVQLAIIAAAEGARTAIAINKLLRDR